MGTMCSLHCPSCGYEAHLTLGIGFLYPVVFTETQEAAKSGKLGATLKRFFAEHPDGAVNPELVAAQCEKCGDYKSVTSLDMYIPKTNREKSKPKGRWSVSMPFPNTDYVVFDEFEKQYTFYKAFPHRCGICRGKVKILRKVDLQKLKCPHCTNQILTVEEYGRWD